MAKHFPLSSSRHRRQWATVNSGVSSPLSTRHPYVMTMDTASMSPVELATLYFELSNRGDLGAIHELMTGATTYSSPHTGVYLGANSIMAMQTKFHRGFKALHWDVESVMEERPGVFRFDFMMTGRDLDGREIIRPGVEYIIVHNGALQHIEVRER